MKLQFFHVDDLCRFVEILIKICPAGHIFNVGNQDALTIKEWVTLCYDAAGKYPQFISVSGEIEQRSYFPFYNYEYYLDVGNQYALMPKAKSMKEGLMESFDWYLSNSDKVSRKPLLEYIQRNLK